MSVYSGGGGGGGVTAPCAAIRPPVWARCPAALPSATASERSIARRPMNHPISTWTLELDGVYKQRPGLPSAVFCNCNGRPL